MPVVRRIERPSKQANDLPWCDKWKALQTQPLDPKRPTGRDLAIYSAKASFKKAQTGFFDLTLTFWKPDSDKVQSVCNDWKFSLFAHFTEWSFAFGLSCFFLGACVIVALYRISANNSLTDADFQKIAVHSAKDGLTVQDMNGIVLWVNQAYCDIHRRTPSEVIGRNPLRYAIPDDQMPSEEEIRNFSYHESDPILKRLDRFGMHLVQNQRGDGELFWLEITTSQATGPRGEVYVVSVCRDVTLQVENEIALKNASEALEQMSHLDALTGIANRRGLTEFYANLATAGQCDGQSVGLFHIDLDRFKEVNDLKGHAAGDALLQHISTNLSKTIRKSDLVARAGGDEFVAVCPGIVDRSQLTAIASSIASAISKPMTWQDSTIQISASIGAVLADPSESLLDDVLNQADFALYSVKSRGRDAVQVFDKSFEAAFERQSRRTKELTKAIANGELTHHYQPVLRAATGEVRKFEVFTRWNHPSLGLLTADEFLDVAEATGRMSEVDILAAKAAASLLSDIKAAGHQTMRVGINVSLSFLRSSNAVERLTAILKSFDVPPHRFVIEVPEAAIASAKDQQEHLNVLQNFREEGFLIIVDDFRAGSLGLTQLPNLPINGLKISRTITSELETNEVQRKVLKAVLEVAADLKLQTIVPGIETAERAKLVTSFNGDRVQGHWYASPMPIDQVLPWIDQHYSKFNASTDIAPPQDHRYLGANSEL